jgi:hypothetical protein
MKELFFKLVSELISAVWWAIERGGTVQRLLQ